MLAGPIQSWTRSTPNPLLNKCVAQQCLSTWKWRRCSEDAGRGAVLLHQQMECGAVDRPLLLRQENRAREGSAHLQPGAERPSFFAHQVVMAGIGALQPVNEDLGGFGV